jgi:hypothetical protein
MRNKKSPDLPTTSSPRDLVTIGQVADALIRLHASMDVTGA